MNRLLLIPRPAMILLGTLWLLQGLGLAPPKPMLCLVDCAPLKAGFGLWIGVGAATVVSGLYAKIRVLGGRFWDRRTGQLVARLQAARVAPAPTRHHAVDLIDLPAPVQRYFRAALTEGQAIVTAVTLTQRGLFNLGATGAHWRPFTATQHFTTRRPGFIWDAVIDMAPLVPVRVVDALIAGTGLLRPAILGLFDLGKMEGTGEIAQGELLRHLAESVWFPTALLAGQGVVWQALDETSAMATLSDGPLSASMVFRFGAEGLVSSLWVAGRAMTRGKTTVQMPWECRLSNHQSRDGMQVPLTGEALYLTPEGERSYFKGTITGLMYERAP